MDTTKELKVKGIDDVEIVYTKDSKFHKAGDRSTVHRIQAEKLVKKGIATKSTFSSKD